jgi:L-fuconolactonase
MDRRAFLAAAAASSAASLAAAQKDKPLAKPHSLPIVDTHQHLWDLNKFKLAWFDPDSAEGKILGHSFTPKEYAEATRGLNVVKAVYMEVDVVPEQQQKEADYIVELCASGKTPTCAAVVSGRPNSAGFAQYAKQFKGSKYVKGIRQVLHVKGATPAYFLDKKFVKGIQLLGDLGLSFDLCVRPEELPEHIQLVDQCPGTRFILDHCGNGKITHKPAEREQWKKNMTAIGKRKNVVGKVSGIIASAPARGKWTLDDLAPIINHTLESFGPADWVNALMLVVKDRSEEQQRKLFHDNAVNFYGL